MAHAAVVVLALGVPVLVFALTGDVPLRVLALPLTVLVLLLVARLQLRRELVADAFGVDRPRRGRRIGWGEVDHVEKPGPWDAVATLRLEDGARVNTGLPAHLAPRLAELGRVPLRD